MGPRFVPSLANLVKSQKRTSLWWGLHIGLGKRQKQKCGKRCWVASGSHPKESWLMERCGNCQGNFLQALVTNGCFKRKLTREFT